MQKFILLFVSVFLVLAMSIISPSFAKVGGVCSNCHTMHNSQNGTAMVRDDSGNPSSTPNDILLIYSCIGCHSTTNPNTSQHPVTNAPIVYNINGAPTYGNDGLAGGNFYWVSQGSDANGHNVFASNPDDNLNDAPGRPWGCTGNNSCHVNIHGTTGPPFFGLSTTHQGCSKCHMMGTDPPSGYHHADDSDTVIDSAAEGWYRFLAGHQSGSGFGVTGIEDSDWQETSSSSDHNEYLGYVGNKNSAAGFSALGNTMTAYCCGCHGVFHIQDNTAVGSSPWLRHPSDAVIPTTGEYSAYNTYDPIVPVARPTLTGWTGPSSTVTPGQDMVMCLSCHKPHGSPYPDMLRWDYNDMLAGDNTKSGGCFQCHSQKND